MNFFLHSLIQARVLYRACSDVLESTFAHEVSNTLLSTCAYSVYHQESLVSGRGFAGRQQEHKGVMEPAETGVRVRYGLDRSHMLRLLRPETGLNRVNPSVKYIEGKYEGFLNLARSFVVEFGKPPSWWYALATNLLPISAFA
ncbi:hypothetical protein Tco_0126489 [Tanacetum coccineum]